MPNCAAAPSNIVYGLSRNGLKSIMAPMPMKMSNGKISHMKTPYLASTANSPPRSMSEMGLREVGQKDT